ncbi:MAG: hypothetical protein ABEH43_04170, partial [Flavobacteriales bacterium]
MELKWSSLKHKQYSNKGFKFTIKGRFFTGKEKTIHSSSTDLRDTVNSVHQWGKFTIDYEGYYKIFKPWKLGVNIRGVFSTQPFFANQRSSLLMAPAYNPIPESNTLFLKNFRANKYFGFGLKNILSITENFNFRLEGYLFEPFRPILKKENFSPRLGDRFSKVFFMGSSSLVYHTPIGPVSL